MSMLALAASEGHDLAPMIMDPIWFPVIAGALFVFFAFVVWSFRDASNRHSHKAGSLPHGESPHGTDQH